MKNSFFLFLLVFILFLLSEIYPQRTRREEALKPAARILFSEIHQAPNGTSTDLFYIFKIPYNKLVFEKNGDKYEASYRLSIEVVDSNKNFVVRQIKEKNIIANDFNETTNPAMYSSDVINFKLPKGNYYLLPNIADKNSGREAKLPEIHVRLKDFSNSDFFDPITAYNAETNCNNSEKYFIPNFNGDVPFDINSYDLIIPSSDLSLSNIFVTIINNKDTVFDDKVSHSFIGGGGFEECENKIIFIDDNSTAKFKYFVIRNFNKNLIEGKLLIIVSKQKDTSSKNKFIKAVNWFNMPLSLRNAEFAIESLKYIEDEKKIDSLLDADEKDYHKILFNYWKKYDPTPETSFNELMNEYYLRIDYAAKNFSSISGKQGFDSDRGKIFIKFGKPNKVERNSTELGKIVETWTYEKPEKKFIFVDERGTGEYQLKNG